MGDAIRATGRPPVSPRGQTVFQAPGVGRETDVYLAIAGTPRRGRGLGSVQGLIRRLRIRTAVSLLVMAMMVLSCDGSGASPSGPTVDLSGGMPLVEVHSEPRLESIAEAVGRDPAVWAPMSGIDSPIELLDGAPVTVWFVEDLTRLDSLGLAAAEPWVAGVANPSERIIALRIDGPQRNLSVLRAVYRHEVAHVLLHAATGGNVPRWFHEGYAQAMSGTWNWNDGWRLHFVLLRRGQSALGDLNRGLRGDMEPRTAYLLSYTAVATLREMSGDQGLSALFAELRSGKSFEAALRSVYGLTGGEFEKRWRGQVLDRYGWLYLFSRTGLIWLFVAGLVFVLGISRVRRDKQRLEQMAAEECGAESGEWMDVDDSDSGI